MMGRSRKAPNGPVAEGTTGAAAREGTVRAPHFPISGSSARQGAESTLPVWRKIVRSLTIRGAGVSAVLRWELRSFVLRPSAFVIWLAATLVATAGFSWVVAVLARGGAALSQADDPIVQFVGPNLFLVGLCTLLVPLLTMSLVADDRRRGTWELLLTSPVSRGEALTGKFLAGWFLLLTALLPWFCDLLVLRFWNGGTTTVWGVLPWLAGSGVPFDPGPIVGAGIGLATIGATFIAVGLFCSSLCRRPLAAALLTFTAMLLLLALSFLPRVLEAQGFAHERLAWLDTLSCWGHLEGFSRGMILPRVVAGHLSACLVLIRLATEVSRGVDDG